MFTPSVHFHSLLHYVNDIKDPSLFIRRVRLDGAHPSRCAVCVNADWISELCLPEHVRKVSTMMLLAHILQLSLQGSGTTGVGKPLCKYYHNRYLCDWLTRGQ